MRYERPEGRATDPALDPPTLPGLPRPRCPVCYGIACPACHRADEVRMPWSDEERWWHFVCQRCSIVFREGGPETPLGEPPAHG